MTVVNGNCSRTTWLFANSKLQCNQPLKKDASAASQNSLKYEMAPILAPLWKVGALIVLCLLLIPLKIAVYRPNQPIFYSKSAESDYTTPSQEERYIRCLNRHHLWHRERNHTLL